jgi:hypothetical protein
VKATTSDHFQILDAVVDDLDDLLWEIRASRPEDEEIILDSIFSPGPALRDVFDEIPRSDITYRAIGNTLVPHSYLPSVSLFQFRTFRGSLAFQPCSKQIHHLKLFRALRPVEGVHDAVFEQAREWSCFVQAMDDLPRDVRWLLAMIYNFVSEMLRYENTEIYLWNMRNWLLH